MMTKIYVLTEPGGEIRYVGKTAKSLHTRLTQHLSITRNNGKSHLYNWLRSVLSTGYLPIISLIGEVEGDGCKEEIAWIAYGRNEGWRLVNTTDGGEGVKGYKASEEKLNKMRGRHPSAETLKRLSESHKGHVPSKETCKKLSQAGFGRIQSEKARQKLRVFHTGLKHSKETLKKMSEAKKGTHFHKGYHHSETTKAKIREASKKQFAAKENNQTTR